jgi:hypothetical protein
MDLILAEEGKERWIWPELRKERRDESDLS